MSQPDDSDNAPAARPNARPKPRLMLRLDFGGGRRVGPGKIDLIEAVGRTGSISAAGRAMGMSYRRSWLLVSAVNDMFDQPVVISQAGGKEGGGAQLTQFGARLVEAYRALEVSAQATSDVELADIAQHLVEGGRR